VFKKAPAGNCRTQETWATYATCCTKGRCRPEAAPHAAHHTPAHHAGSEYRASVTVDAETDRRDRRAGCRISCPVLVLWSDGAVNDWYADVGGPLALWKQWAPYAHGERVSGGHFFPEANPDATHDLLRDFFLQG